MSSEILTGQAKKHRQISLKVKKCHSTYATLSLSLCSMHTYAYFVEPFSTFEKRPLKIS